MVDERTEILAAVGEALDSWSDIELHLTSLFAVIADFQKTKHTSAFPSFGTKAHAIFETIISFETRIDVLDALMAQEGLAPLDLETWNRFSARLMKLYKKRHQLAHFSLVHVPKKKDEAEVRLSPFLTWKGMFTGDIKYLDVHQILERRDHFEEATKVVKWFDAAAQRRRGRPPNILEQEPPLLARLRESAAQILEERARKQPPSRPLSEML